MPEVISAPRDANGQATDAAPSTNSNFASNGGQPHVIQGDSFMKHNNPKNTKKMDLDDIRINGGTQPREKINEKLVKEYAEAMQAGVKFPSVTVFYDGKNHWLVDGFHRWYAARKAERTTIVCTIRKGTLEDARWSSCCVNSDHGLRRTNADKKKAVQAALLHPKGAEMSDRQIAEHVKVDPKTVAKVRKELDLTEEIHSQQDRTGRDGRTINTTKIGSGKRRKKEKDEYETEDEPEDESEDEYEDEPEYEPEDEEEDEDAEEEEEEYEEEEDEEEDEEPEETEEFDESEELDKLREWLREKLELWPDECRAEAARLIRRVLEKDFNL